MPAHILSFIMRTCSRPTVFRILALNRDYGTITNPSGTLRRQLFGSCHIKDEQSTWPSKKKKKLSQEFCKRLYAMQSWTYCALVIRVLVAFCTRTFFQPDEYFQSLEPAYHLVFGYGHLTWEWLSPQPVRSIIYPALNVPIYWLLKTTRLSESEILGDWLLVSNCFVDLLGERSLSIIQISCPKILHGLLAAGTDIWLAELSRIVLGRDYVSTVVRAFQVNDHSRLTPATAFSI